MKKNYFVAGAVLLMSVSMSFAQVSKAGKRVLIGTKNYVPVKSAERMNNPDTTGIVNVSDFLPEYNPGGGQNSMYGYVGGGYLYGKNADTLDACAQGYLNVNSTPIRITGVIAWFGAKKSVNGPTGGTGSAVTIKAWKLANNKAYNTNNATPPAPSLNSPGPSTSLSNPIASIILPYADIDTADFVFADFATPPAVPGDFAIGVDFNTLAAGDTAGLVCDPDNSAGNIDLAFHNWFGNWFVTDFIFSSSGSGEFDTNIALWAILADATGVDEFYNGMKLTTYPNPTVEKATVEYTLEKNSDNVNLVVFDKSGRKILVQKYSSQPAGTYKAEIEASNLAAGTYFYQLTANGLSFTKKFVVTK